jgi:hypothetical protein
VASGALQGWHADPFGLHEMRYFSVGRPTKLVRDGRLESYDEPPVDGAATPVDGALAAAPVATAAGPVAAAADGDDALRDLVASDGWISARRKRRRREYAAVAAGAVVAVLVFVALAGGSGNRGIAPAAFVTAAAQRTLDQTSADVTVSGTAHLAGQTLAMGGSGEVNFSTDVMSLNLGASIAGGSMTESELLTGGNLYLQVTADGRNLATAIGGRHWIEIPFSQSGTQSVTDGSPASSLSLLKQQGASVTSLGTKNINGQTCSGYAVTPSKQAMLAGAQAEWANMGLSQAQTSATLQALQGETPPTITAWFDSQRQLACQVTVDMQVGAPSSAGTDDVQMVMTFTHYGVPVQVTAPAAADTVSLQQLVQAASH